MRTATLLKQKLMEIDGRDYGHYQSLSGCYDFNRFTLILQQIPQDPYAPPQAGIYRVQVRRDDPRIVNFSTDSRVRRIAFSDFLARAFFETSRKIAGKRRGTGHSGIITIDRPGQSILERNSVVITKERIEVRCFVGLPAMGRRIVSESAAYMLFDALPHIVEQSLLAENIDQRALQRHIEVAEDAEYLRSKLDSRGLVAFVADNSVLPRESGTSDRLMVATPVIPFSAPDSLVTKIDLPHAGSVTGMGIPKGVTLITGGGYHGKSTLLEALEVGIYNHIPGDGRERCVSNEQAVKIRAYSGRSVVKTDISSFINRLPFGKETASFCTANASGSTSQAASIVEAIESGAEVILMDEDTCATNFIVRDSKMQQLVAKEDEPITPFIDVVRQLYTEKNISTVLVLGGVGDYFDVADHVIQMAEYRPTDVTCRAREIAARFPVKRRMEAESHPITIRDRIPLAESFDPLNTYGKFRIFAREVDRLHFGRQVVDLTDLEQLVELSQTRAIGYALEYAKKYMDEKTPLQDIIQRVIKDIDEKGIDVISSRICGHFAQFRGLELAFALNRFRSLSVL
ncbi:ABC-ATPase domain-containing protein [uncultured Desulfosarcina sp.]|uniref:ABC-ATPase domain-containing protein n=1 Tax=uncultured Desulfosarcina sp. TaxID=218289 RepID=UPI0029C8A209|nr:ABC-ATPase domain-containing protein [uncultured Desulfosarcina sp.]